MEQYIQWFESIPVESKILYFTLFVVAMVGILAMTSIVTDFNKRRRQVKQPQQPLPTSLQINTTEPGIRDRINELLVEQELEQYGDQIITRLHQQLAFLNQQILEYKDTEIPNFFFRGELNKAKRLVIEKGKKENDPVCFLVAGKISYVELEFNDCYQRMKKAHDMDPSNEQFAAEFDEIATLLETRIKRKKKSPTKPAEA